METDLVYIDRGVFYITERRRRQVFAERLFWVVLNSVQFSVIKTTYAREPWHCGVQRQETIVHAFAWFRNWLHQNNAPCLISLFNKKYVRQRKLNYRHTSIPPVLKLAKKLNLMLKNRNYGHVTGRLCVEYSVWGQSRGVVWGQLLLFLTFSYKGNI